MQHTCGITWWQRNARDCACRAICIPAGMITGAVVLPTCLQQPLCHMSGSSFVQDMETLVCRQTLAGHKHDVLCISGLQLPPFPRVNSRAMVNAAWDSTSSLAQVAIEYCVRQHMHQCGTCLSSSNSNILYLGQDFIYITWGKHGSMVHGSRASWRESIRWALCCVMVLIAAGNANRRRSEP